MRSPCEKRDKNFRTAEQFRRMKENDFRRVRFDVVPTNPSGESGPQGTRRSLEREDPHLSGCGESIAGAQWA